MAAILIRRVKSLLMQRGTSKGGIMAAKVEKVKNVVLVGQGGVGKTMLAEAMLHLTGRTTRLG